MAYKTVSGARTAEIRLDGSVCTVNFGNSYNYYAVRNDSDGMIYVSTTDKSCAPGNDGVVSIPSGGGYVHYNGFGGSSEIYISGTGGALVIAQDDGVCPFKPAPKGGDSSGSRKQLTLFEGSENDYTLADGLTGFEVINGVPAGAVFEISNADEFGYSEDIYTLSFKKLFSIGSAGGFGFESEHIDSAIFASSEEIDLTGYRYLLIEFFSGSDYTNNISTNLFGGAYFKVDEPENLPESNVPYNRDDWTDMYANYRQYGRFYADISAFLGVHKLCIGVCHGNYNVNYGNAIKIKKITLV